MIITANLKKGDRIAYRVLEKEFKCSILDEQYGLKMMELKNRIQNESEAMGKPLLCRQDCKALVIMTDAQATEYKDLKADSDRRRYARTVSHLDLIDKQNLNRGEKLLLSESKRFNNAILSAMHQAVVDFGIRKHRAIPQSKK